MTKRKYMRRCHRCDNIYNTSARSSKICNNCIKPHGGGMYGKNKSNYEIPVQPVSERVLRFK